MMRHSLFSLLGIQRVSAARRRRPGQSASSAEDLEIRQLLAAEVRLVANIGAQPETLTDVNGKLFFVSNLGEITTSDGREQGTRSVKPGAAGFFPRHLTNVGGTLFYSAKNVAEGGFELWKSDGTAAGTGLVKDIRPGAVGSALGELTDVGGTVFFFANDGITGTELWKSDGTAAGTVLVKDIKPGIGDSLPRHLTNVGGTLYFRADDGVNGLELWRSDGTSAGTVMVQDSVPGINGSFPDELTDVNGTLFYTTNLHANRGLWKSDGTNAGTGVVRVSPANELVPRELTEVGGTLYFRAGPGFAVELWKSDGSPIGTVKVANIDVFQNVDHSFTDFNGTLIFKKFTQAFSPGALWKSDGTGPGTVAIASPVDANFQNGHPQTLPFPVHNGFIYFDSQGLLVQSDGTSVGPVTGALSGSGNDSGFVSVGDALYFVTQGQLASLHEISSPTVIAPSTPTTNVRPMLSWTAVPGATSYDVVVTDLTRGVDNFFTATVPGTSVIPNIDFGLGRFSVSVRVAATSIVGQQSNWSDPLVFRSLARVTPQALNRLQSTARPTFAWNPLQGATQYDLWIDNFTTGQSQVVRMTTTETSFTPTSDLPMGVYRAYVRGQTIDGVTGRFSMTTEFVVVPAPTVIGPLNSTFSRQPTFSWNAVTGAVAYELVLRNANNGQVVHNPTITSGTSWPTPADLPVGTYRWQVAAVSSDGYQTQAPQVITFFVGGRTDVLTPTGTTSDRTPTFSWRPVDGAASYQIQVDRRDVAVVRIINETSLVATTEFTPTTPLPVGTYRVWVRAIGTFGELGLWSLPVDFQVTQTSETLNDSLIAVLPTDDVLSVVLDGRQEHRSTPRTTVVSNDPRSDESVDVFVAEAEFVARQPVTIDRTATRTDKEHAERIHDGILDRLMASQGEADDLTWMF